MFSGLIKNRLQAIHRVICNTSFPTHLPKQLLPKSLLLDQQHQASMVYVEDLQNS